MKHVKKLLALFLIMLMVATLPTTALAKMPDTTSPATQLELIDFSTVRLVQCLSAATHFLDDDTEELPLGFGLGYTTQAMVDEAADVKCDTLEELAEIVGYTGEAKTNFLAEVERYNELAHAGKDADFSKVSTRLFPVENPPYYAVPFGDSGMLVLIGGIDCDVDCRALDAEKNPVPGLFVAGNTMGGRFLVDYPVTVAGASHSMAMSFGRLAGRKAAEGK